MAFEEKDKEKLTLTIVETFHTNTKVSNVETDKKNRKKNA